MSVFLSVVVVGLALVMGVGPFGRLRASERAEVRTGQAEVDALVLAWERAAEGVGFVRSVQTVTGITVVLPKIVHVVLGPPPVLTIRLEPGQTVTDLRALAVRLAPHLGGIALRVEPVGLGVYVRVTVLDVDPLAEMVPVVLADDGSVVLGRLDDGATLAQDIRREAHMIVQGVTRSGKSVLTYGLLVQLARADDVLITGCDPTGLLWRPFAGTRHAPWQVSGLADLDAHETLLSRLVAEMDARIGDLPADRDTVEITPDRPALVVVLEELAGLYRAVDAASKDQGRRIRALISRLLAEGAKAGVRVVILVQRAEAAVVGAFERAMCSTRVSFRTDNRASVELLHPGAPVDVADAHTTAEPGVALVSVPGRELLRMRAPFIGGYGDYVAAIRNPR